MANKRLSKLKASLNLLLNDKSFLPQRSSEAGHLNCFTIMQKNLCCPVKNGSINLVEEDAQTSGIKDLWIDDLDSDTIVLKPDRFSIAHFKKGTYNKACDYLVLTKPVGATGSELYAFFIDLKTDARAISFNPEETAGNLDYSIDSEKERLWQMAGARVLLDSLMGLSKKLGYIPDLYQFRCVCFDFCSTKIRVSASNGGAIATKLNLPSSKLIDCERAYWYITRNGARISAKELSEYY